MEALWRRNTKPSLPTLVLSRMQLEEARRPARTKNAPSVGMSQNRNCRSSSHPPSQAVQRQAEDFDAQSMQKVSASAVALSRSLCRSRGAKRRTNSRKMRPTPGHSTSACWCTACPGRRFVFGCWTPMRRQNCEFLLTHGPTCHSDCESNVMRKWCSEFIWNGTVRCNVSALRSTDTA